MPVAFACRTGEPSMKFRLGNQGKNRKLAAFSFWCAATCFIGVAGATRVSAQEPASAAKSDAKPTPRLADGHPDLNGYWDTGGNNNLAVVKDGQITRATLD